MLTSHIHLECQLMSHYDVDCTYHPSSLISYYYTQTIKLKSMLKSSLYFCRQLLQSNNIHLPNVPSFNPDEHWGDLETDCVEVLHHRLANAERSKSNLTKQLNQLSIEKERFSSEIDVLRKSFSELNSHLNSQNKLMKQQKEASILLETKNSDLVVAKKNLIQSNIKLKSEVKTLNDLNSTTNNFLNSLKLKNNKLIKETSYLRAQLNRMASSNRRPRPCIHYDTYVQTNGSFSSTLEVKLLALQETISRKETVINHLNNQLKSIKENTKLKPPNIVQRTIASQTDPFNNPRLEEELRRQLVKVNSLSETLKEILSKSNKSSPSNLYLERTLSNAMHLTMEGKAAGAANGMIKILEGMREMVYRDAS
ncbi:hypothetical protein P9112_012554 [Eukaryota sp. TZLM1-RC]